MKFIFIEANIEEVPCDEMELEGALLFLDDLTMYLKECQQQNIYTYRLLEDDKPVYEGTLNLPQDDFRFYEQIRQQVLAIEDPNTRQFWDYLEPLLLASSSRLKDERAHFLCQEEQQSHLSTDERNDSNEKHYDSEEHDSIEEDGRNEDELEPVPQGIVVTKRFLVFFVAGILTIGVLAISIKVVPSFMQDRTPSYQQLLSQEKYVKAGKLYPEKTKAIEEILYQKVLDNRSDQTMKKLLRFNQSYETLFGTFDLAIFQKNYSEAISVYEGDESSFENKEDRLLLVGYAYLKEEKVKQAETISSGLKSRELEKKLFKYNQLKQAISEKEAELKELEKGGSKNREQAEKVANERFDLQEQLLNI